MTLPEHHITRYQRWLHDTRSLQFDSYDALWRWSVDDLPAFWASISEVRQLHPRFRPVGQS